MLQMAMLWNSLTHKQCNQIESFSTFVTILGNKGFVESRNCLWVEVNKINYSPDFKISDNINFNAN